MSSKIETHVYVGDEIRVQLRNHMTYLGHVTAMDPDKLTLTLDSSTVIKMIEVATWEILDMKNRAVYQTLQRQVAMTAHDAAMRIRVDVERLLRKARITSEKLPDGLQYRHPSQPKEFTLKFHMGSETSKWDVEHMLADMLVLNILQDDPSAKHIVFRAEVEVAPMINDMNEEPTYIVYALYWLEKNKQCFKPGDWVRTKINRDIHVGNDCIIKLCRTDQGVITQQDPCNPFMYHVEFRGRGFTLVLNSTDVERIG